MSLILLSVAVIGLAMLIMAVGVVFKRRALRGSCGGSEIFDCDGDPITCGACPNRRDKTPRKAHPAELLREMMGSPER